MSDSQVGPFQLLKAQTPAFTRITNPQERKRAKQGKWVFFDQLDCEEFAFDPLDPGQIWHKGCSEVERLALIAPRLWTIAPDLGFAVREIDGVKRWGFIVPSKEVGEFYELCITAWFEADVA